MQKKINTKSETNENRIILFLRKLLLGICVFYFNIKNNHYGIHWVKKKNLSAFYFKKKIFLIGKNICGNRMIGSGNLVLIKKIDSEIFWLFLENSRKFIDFIEKLIFHQYFFFLITNTLTAIFCVCIYFNIFSKY